MAIISMTIINSLVSSNRNMVALALALACGLLLTACSYGSFAPEVRLQDAGNSQYLELLQSKVVEGSAFGWESLASELIVKVLPYDQTVQQTAEQKFEASPGFAEGATTWLKPSWRSSSQPIVVIMGIYAPNITEEDITETKRFHPRLLTSGGQFLEPLEIIYSDKQNSFIRDYFPIFNPWEKIFVVKFAGDGSNKPLAYQINWPGGVQTLTFSD